MAIFLLAELRATHHKSARKPTHLLFLAHRRVNVFLTGFLAGFLVIFLVFSPTKNTLIGIRIIRANQRVFYTNALLFVSCLSLLLGFYKSFEVRESFFIGFPQH